LRIHPHGHPAIAPEQVAAAALPAQAAEVVVAALREPAGAALPGLAHPGLAGPAGVVHPGLAGPAGVVRLVLAAPGWPVAAPEGVGCPAVAGCLIRSTIRSTTTRMIRRYPELSGSAAG